MTWRLIELVLFGAVLIAIERTRRTAMAVGPEVTAALAELDVRIKAEADQRADEVIEAVGADAETAALIRSKFGAVAAIVPDTATETETGGEAGTGTETGETGTEGESAL